MKQKNWFSRNWVWFIPSLVIGFFFIIVAFIFAIFFLVTTMFKSSDVYKIAYSQAQNNTQVQQILGTPIKEGLFSSGSVTSENGEGNADITIPISGPNGKGSIKVVASMHNRNWIFTKMIVTFKKSETVVDLLSQKQKPALE